MFKVKIDDYRATFKKFVVRYLVSLLVWFPVSTLIGQSLVNGDTGQSWFSRVETLLFWLDLYPFAVVAACLGGAIFSSLRNERLFLASLYLPVVLIIICVGLAIFLAIGLL